MKPTVKTESWSSNLRFRRTNRRIREHRRRHRRYKCRRFGRPDYNRLRARRYERSEVRSRTWNRQRRFTIHAGETGRTGAAKTIGDRSIVHTRSAILAIDKVTQKHYERRLLACLLNRTELTISWRLAKFRLCCGTADEQHNREDQS